VKTIRLFFPFNIGIGLAINGSRLFLEWLKPWQIKPFRKWVVNWFTFSEIKGRVFGLTILGVHPSLFWKTY